MTLTLQRPTIGGHMPLTVGRTRYGIPRGSRVAHVSLGRKRLAWVLDIDGRVHAFVEGGEVEIPEPIQQLVKEKIFRLTS